MKRKPRLVQRRVARDGHGSYDFGYFGTPGGKGVDVGEVLPGRYTVLVSMSTGGALFTKEVCRNTLKGR
ncbi:hypothetical protein AQ490_19515 [Wenjunlia vitaminophila]|uniref:Uncharacterized protein n=1 Tax=Wenjunlia vitaminophila TaxID=76728 RepID=A0A0T6LUK5_WENVI|nr:hypothetical protein [Wenjunlia vitaminophila]KRV49522.1 hypothetical protein AQ490_19515 [Wenjunlia vitaminophila]